jgi:hypothetical protein
LVPIRQVTDPKINFGSSFFLWIRSVGSTTLMLLSFRIRECFHKFYARILTLMLVIFLCGVTIGVLDPDWIFMLPSGRRHRFSTHASHIFLYGIGIRKFSLDPQNVVFLFGSVPFIRADPLLFTTIEISAFINTFTMCHSTRSRRRRRRAATPATTPTRRTWTWRGRRRRTTPSRPTRTPRWIRTRPSSSGGRPQLQSLDDCLAPWYATPFRLNILLLLDRLLLFLRSWWRAWSC